jgi:hypothetical protein
MYGVRKLQAAWLVVLLAALAAAQTQVNLDTQVKGSKWPASATDTGTANAYAVTVTLAPILRTNSLIIFKATNANTGASTLAVNGGTAIAITKSGTTALSSGDIAAGQEVAVVYDGTEFQMVAGAGGGGGAGTILRVCDIDNDTQAAAALTDAQITGRCDVPAGATLAEIDVYASGGTPTVLLERWRPNGGATADLLSATLPTAAAGAYACAMSTTSATCVSGITSSGSITLSNTSLAAGDVVRVKTATAGGTATWHHIAVIFSIPAASGTGNATIAGVQQESYICANDTGTTNAYAVTLSPAPTISTYSVVCFKAANGNTGASTLAVNGGTATAIKKNATVALASGDISTSQVAVVIYDGTNFQLIDPNAISTANKTRTCAYQIGIDGGGTISTAEIQPQKSVCYFDVASTVTQILVKADSGASTVQLAYRHSTTTTNYTSGVLTPATVTNIADKVVCANTGGTSITVDGVSVTCSTLASTSGTLGDSVETVGGTADGTTNRLIIFLTFTAN